MDISSFSIIALVGSCFGLFLGGLSKGALGVGMPLISVPALAFFMPIPQALVILTVPIFITNIWQALQGGHLKVVIQRFWPMTIALAIGIGIGAQILVRLQESTLYLIMGSLVLTQPAVRLFRPNTIIPDEKQKVLAPLVSFMSGIVGGMSGFFGPLIMVYLAMVRLPKDIFTATVAVLFFVGGVALAAFLAQLGVMTKNDLLMSCIALAPATGGIYIGQKIRAKISQVQFDKALTVMMFLMGISLLWKGL